MCDFRCLMEDVVDRLLEVVEAEARSCSMDIDLVEVAHARQNSSKLCFPLTYSRFWVRHASLGL